MRGLAYWLCDLVRQLDCIDDAKSKVAFQTQVDSKAYDLLIDVKIRADEVNDAHAFRLVHQHNTWIVDDILVQAMTAAKIRAWRFEPIQQA
ncbi:imm11 family protein [Aquabacterium sp.]|uniref:imm11 family protein n=1 Tax=Aquabacterium sp. TaxID=1872578 RepID=UPI004037E281